MSVFLQTLKRAALVFLLMVILGGIGYVGLRAWRGHQSDQPKNLPPEKNVAVENRNTTPRNTNVAVTTNTSLNTNAVVAPAELNLAAPFTTQAPDANWDAEHEEFCEEASVLMAARALQGRAIKDSADAEAALQTLQQWEIDTFGYFESTTAVEIAQLVTDFYGLSAELVVDPTVSQLKSILASGKFIVVPAAGRELHNPNFKQPGPLYHALLLKGYTATTFITNDPGTRKGQNYTYPTDVLMQSIHDWNGGDVMNGRRVVIVVSAARE